MTLQILSHFEEINSNVIFQLKICMSSKWTRRPVEWPMPIANTICVLQIGVHQSTISVRFLYEMQLHIDQHDRHMNACLRIGYLCSTVQEPVWCLLEPTRDELLKIDHNRVLKIPVHDHLPISFDACLMTLWRVSVPSCCVGITERVTRPDRMRQRIAHKTATRPCQHIAIASISKPHEAHMSARITQHI